MTSFIRTIPKTESPNYIDEILSRSDHFIPLPFIPKRSVPGDYIYLAFRGVLKGRAKIERIEPHEGQIPISSSIKHLHAKCLVRYRGGWQKPSRIINFKGTQGIRYIDRLGMREMDILKF